MHTQGCTHTPLATGSRVHSWMRDPGMWFGFPIFHSWHRTGHCQHVLGCATGHWEPLILLRVEDWGPRAHGGTDSAGWALSPEALLFLATLHKVVTGRCVPAPGPWSGYCRIWGSQEGALSQRWEGCWMWVTHHECRPTSVTGGCVKSFCLLPPPEASVSSLVK